jgi:hypothetical protein
MKLLILNALLMIVLIGPVANGALLSEYGRPSTCVTDKFPNRLSLVAECSNDFQIILAAVRADECSGKCSNDLQTCVDRCPGFDESNVVDPKYAKRKCKAACDAALSECKSGCPKN